MAMLTTRFRLAPAELFGSLILAFLLLAAGRHECRSQPVDRALMLGLGAGLTFYHGEFNSLQDPFSPVPALTVAGTLQYTISRVFAVGAQAASSTLCYQIEPFARTKYASNFFGPAEATDYPGSTVMITERNSVATTSLYLYGKVYLNGLLPPDWTLYGFGGIGVIGFTPMNDNGEQLPTNLTGPYDETSLMIPFGGGAEYTVSEKLRASLEYTFHSGFTDYLDGYAHYLDYETTSVPSGPGVTSTQSDHHSTLRLGLSYQLYREMPEQTQRPTAASPSPAPNDTPLGRPERDRPAANSPAASRPDAPADQSDPPAHRRVENADRGIRDPASVGEPDSDGDLLSDREETDLLGTDPQSRDSDGDGLDDGEEVRLYGTDPLKADTDGDLLSDLSEVRYHGTSPRSGDSDMDRLGDNEEISRTGTDPLRADSDRDGLIDGEDDCPLEPGPRSNRGCPEAAAEHAAEPAEANPSLPALEPGVRREFSTIYFLQNSDRFDFSRPETEASLAALRDYLASCREVGVLIEGHTSSEGNGEWNRRLSAMRADRVRSWLLDQGIAPAKILGTVGYGSRLPKVAEPPPGHLSGKALERVRAQNRRITTLLRLPCR